MSPKMVAANFMHPAPHIKKPNSPALESGPGLMTCLINRTQKWYSGIFEINLKKPCSSHLDRLRDSLLGHSLSEPSWHALGGPSHIVKSWVGIPADSLNSELRTSTDRQPYWGSYPGCWVTLDFQTTPTLTSTCNCLRGSKWAPEPHQPIPVYSQIPER